MSIDEDAIYAPCEHPVTRFDRVLWRLHNLLDSVTRYGAHGVLPGRIQEALCRAWERVECDFPCASCERTRMDANDPLA